MARSMISRRRLLQSAAIAAAGIAAPALMRQLTREEDYRRWMREFLDAR